MISEFDILVESLLTRYKIGGLLVGDQIKFKDGIKTDSIFNGLNDAEKEVLLDLIAQETNGDAIIKIAGINQAPWEQGSPQATPCSLDVGIDMGGGRYYNTITIPGELVKHIQKVNVCPNNVAQTVAPNNIIDYTQNQKVVELTDEDAEGASENSVPNKQNVQKMPTKDNKMANAGTAPTVDYSKDVTKVQDVNDGKLDTKALAKEEGKRRGRPKKA